MKTFYECAVCTPLDSAVVRNISAMNVLRKRYEDYSPVECDIMYFGRWVLYQHFWETCCLHLLPWRWNQQVPPKHWYLTANLCEVMSQGTVVLIFIAVKTRGLENWKYNGITLPLASCRIYVTWNWYFSRQVKNSRTGSHWLRLRHLEKTRHWVMGKRI
jgi:hypothetical protein